MIPYAVRCWETRGNLIDIAAGGYWLARADAILVSLSDQNREFFGCPLNLTDLIEAPGLPQA